MNFPSPLRASRRAFAALLLLAAGASAQTDATVPADSLEFTEIVSPVAGASAPVDSQTRVEPRALPRGTKPLSVTFAPVMLLIYVPEVTVEYLLTRHVSASVMGGWGGRTFSDGGEARVREAGGQVRWYTQPRAAKGVHFGVQGYWARLRQVLVNDGDSFLSAVGGEVEFIAVGPFVGTKIVYPYGLTIDLQVGFQYAKALDENNSITAPFLSNINLGWSF